MHGLMYLIAVLLALGGIVGGFAMFSPLAPMMGITVAVSGIIAAATFLGIGYIISQLYEVNRKLDKSGSDERKVAP